MAKKTSTIKKSKDKLAHTNKVSEGRLWYLVDAKDQVLGRLATQIATILRGKKKVEFVPWRDNGDWVVVINAADIRVTGKKLEQKIYYRHTGFPGGIKQRTLGKRLQEKPEWVLWQAVRGMLSDNKLRKPFLRRLKIFPGKKHTFTDKKLITIK